jgi:hypothetical protein
MGQPATWDMGHPYREMSQMSHLATWLRDMSGTSPCQCLRHIPRWLTPGNGWNHRTAGRPPTARRFRPVACAALSDSLLFGGAWPQDLSHRRRQSESLRGIHLKPIDVAARQSPLRPRALGGDKH